MDKVKVYWVLIAKPYRDFSGWMHEGKIHLGKDKTDEKGQLVTFCGKTSETCPGVIRQGDLGAVTCKVCLRSVESAERQEENRRRWEAESLERERERHDNDRQWWMAYNLYLEGPLWREKRRIVLVRCHGICEGCGINSAREVHHLSYPRNCLAGSPEWDKQEKLFTLVGICGRCHEDLHSVGAFDRD